MHISRVSSFSGYWSLLSFTQPVKRHVERIDNGDGVNWKFFFDGLSVRTLKSGFLPRRQKVPGGGGGGGHTRPSGIEPVPER